MRLWAGQTISVFGSLTTRIALPFTAILYLDARPLAVALLTSADVLAGIFFGLLAGVWVDRLRRRPIMIGADLGRALLVGSIPASALFGVLHIEQLFAVAFLAGILTSFFDVAYQSYLPTLVETDQLVEGNSKLAASASVAEFGAFSAAGWLVELVTGPGAILIDAVSFLFSAGSLATIRKPEPPSPAIEDRQPVVSEIREGVRAVAHDPILRPLAASFICLSLGAGMIGSVILLFVSRDLGFSPGVQGLIYGVGGVTSLAGAVMADRCRRTLGFGGATMLGLTMGAAGVLLMSFSPAASVVAVLLLVGQQTISDPGWTIYEINAVSLRQSIAPERLQGRINAAFRFGGLVATLVGSVAAGVVADSIGARPVLVAGAGAALLGVVCIAVSPVRGLRGVPAAVKPVPMAEPGG
jgi:MFS family permease